MREILGCSIPSTARERGFVLAGFLLGTALSLGQWLLGVI